MFVKYPPTNPILVQMFGGTAGGRFVGTLKLDPHEEEIASRRAAIKNSQALPPVFKV
jgi:hypothetical protein